uniref:Temporin-1CSd n=2 Tax=Rana TaxID=121175 RepID=TP1D_RANCS|nr:RecName: Full=Temporin-1CSd [Rana cascadae]
NFLGTLVNLAKKIL